MKLKSRTIQDFRMIIEKDYGIIVTDQDAQKLAASLLRLTKLALIVISRDIKNDQIKASVLKLQDSSVIRT